MGTETQEIIDIHTCVTDTCGPRTRETIDIHVTDICGPRTRELIDIRVTDIFGTRTPTSRSV